ncbi:MAG: aminopeptidase P family protein [Hyphomicrobiales bacterium]
MFQDFSPPSADSGDPKRLTHLRDAMAKAGVTGFLIPRADEHQGEYVPACAERLAWLTGFTGSAGMAAVLKDKAAIFIDGRYTLQVRDQVAVDLLEPVHIADQSMGEWLAENLTKDDRLAYDPWLHPVSEIKRLEHKLEKTGAILVAHDNLVDVVWQDRPAPPCSQVVLQPMALSGQEASDKISAMQSEVREMGATAFLITQPDSLCWLLNIRGNDVPHTPLTLGFVIIHADKAPELFINQEKLNDGVKAKVGKLVSLCDKDDLLDKLSTIDGTIAIDPATTGMVFKTHIEGNGGTVLEKPDPCVLPKAIKNQVELAGSRAAHIRDGAAITRFLFWLSNQETSSLNEIKAAKKLESLRKEEGKKDGVPLQDISFDTISGFGANGAIVHYRVTEATNASFKDDTLYLVDSGGQYQDGTTDITRTVPIGHPTDDMKRHFTLVLKGMIAISIARFPKGTSGAQLDSLARHALWQAGHDFDHGTGHGVGSFLSVHEGPQRISKVSTIPLEVGMILSNEPGYYKTDAYGIRIENLIIVTEPRRIWSGDRLMMGFETLTFAPIDRRLVNVSLLSKDELSWFNTYHQSVYEKLADRLDEDERAWLKDMTAPMA